jgi:hypothetical protein
MACSARERHRADFSLLPMRLRCSALARSIAQSAGRRRRRCANGNAGRVVAPDLRIKPAGECRSPPHSFLSFLVCSHAERKEKKRCISYTHSEHEVIPELGFCSAWSLWVTRHTTLMTAVKALLHSACSSSFVTEEEWRHAAEREVPLCRGHELLHVCEIILFHDS